MANTNKGAPKNKKQQQQQSGQKKGGGEKKKQAKKESAGGCSVCKWLFWTSLVFWIVVGVLVYDTNINGGKFEKSTVGKVLKDAGLLPHVENAWTVSAKTMAKGYKWGQNNVPVYYNETCRVMKPYVELTQDLAKISWNGAKTAWNSTTEYVVTKTPIVSNFIDQYIPGFSTGFCSAFTTTWGYIKNGSITAYTFTVDFFKTKVFIGALSPDSLWKHVQTARGHLNGYCNSFHKSVDYYAELK